VSEESTLWSLKRLLVGRPIPSRLARHERLSRVTGLAVLSSDPLSSVAYATEEILRVLILAGAASLAMVTPVAAVIAFLLVVIAFSYRQTIHAYPGGGGAYIVAKDNISVQAGLIAAAALLTDYVLTVAVSIAAGVAAITSALPDWHINRVELCLALVALLALGNLRGIRESGRIFAAPTYFFIASVLLLVGYGGWQVLTGQLETPQPSPESLQQGSAVLSLFLLLRAFSNGCTALTGVEAISNGVPAFRPPEAKNAAATLMTMAVLSVTMFAGITLLARAYRILPAEHETVISQLARAVFGGRGWPYYLVQATTMLILVLAANTAYSDFPRLASILARDRFMPRQFSNLGDRLSFSNGILALSVLAGLLLIAFGGDTHSLIPLYMIGVFVSFSLSQAGMVRKWKRDGGPGWRTSAAINAFGCTLTSVVLVVVAVTKFTEGAWIILAWIPLIVLFFRAIHGHYQRVAEQLSLRAYMPEERRHSTVVVPIGGVNKAVVQALDYARSISDDVRAVYVNLDSKSSEEVKKDWELWGQGLPLIVLRSPYRSLMEPLLDYIEEVEKERPDDFLTIVLPEFVPARWWHHLLHNQRALLIKAALLFKRNITVTSVPYHLRR
jgi:amino acid transporter